MIDYCTYSVVGCWKFTLVRVKTIFENSVAQGENPRKGIFQ